MGQTMTLAEIQEKELTQEHLDALYMKYGKNPSLKGYIGQGFSAKHRDFLAYELWKLLPENEQAQVGHDLLPIPEKGETEPVANEDQQVQSRELSNIQSKLINRRAILSNELADPNATDADRARIVDEMEGLQEQIDSISEQIETGIAPSDKEEKEITNPHRELGNAKSNVSRWKNKLEKAVKGTPEYEHAARLLNQYQQKELKAQAAVDALMEKLREVHDTE
jgi:hypothetical protein